MACKQVNNCDQFPDFDCYETEKKCLCDCEYSDQKDAADCKCVDEAQSCVNGRIRQTDCQCFCGVGKYLENGVCYPYEYSCATNCGEVKRGDYRNRADCNLNCGGGSGGPPFCFPAPQPPVGTPILCPDGRQIGLISYYFDPGSCAWIPWENRWGNCNSPPPPPPPPPDPPPGASSGSSDDGQECDCDSVFPNDQSTTVCGQTVPTLIVNRVAGECDAPPCQLVSVNGNFLVYEWCDTCDDAGNPVLKAVQFFRFIYQSDFDPCKIVCGFQEVPLGPETGGPFPCPIGSSSATLGSSSLSSGQSASSGSCPVATSTQITFIGQTQTGAPLNDFREDDSLLVTIYTGSLSGARAAQTRWTFYAKYDGPTGSAPSSSSSSFSSAESSSSSESTNSSAQSIEFGRYDIATGDFEAPTYPSFILTARKLLELIGFTFENAPNGDYTFEMCAEATNCANLFDSYCATNRVTVRVTQNSSSSSSSSTQSSSSSSQSQTSTSSSSSSGVSSSSSSSSRASSSSNLSSSSSVSSSSVSQTAENRSLFFVGFRPGESVPRSNWNDIRSWRYGSPFGPVPVTLPNATDDVTLLATVDLNSPGVSTVVNTLLAQSVYNTSPCFIEIQITATNGAVLGQNVVLNYDNTTDPPQKGLIVGNTIFTNNAALSDGEVAGDAIFNDTSIMTGQYGGLVRGHATFNDKSKITNGVIHCGATFNDESARLAGSIYGTITCNSTNPCGVPTGTSDCTASAVRVAGVPAFTFPECLPLCSVHMSTTELPAACSTCPEGWDYVNNKCEKTVGEYVSLGDCLEEIWAIKSTLPFISRQYRLMMQGNDGDWYAPAVYFNYQLCRQKKQDGICAPFDCVLIPETFFEDKP